MKLILWIAFAVIAALWSGTVLITAELTKWLAASVPREKTGEPVSVAGDWSAPAWLNIWITPNSMEAFQAHWAQVLGSLGQIGPLFDGVLSGLIPLIWVIWGGVMLIGLLVAMAGHFLIGKLYPSPRLTQRPS